MNNYLSKLGWSLALFVSVICTITAIYAQNLIVMLIFLIINLVIYKYGDPIINAEYNQKKQAKYEKALELRKKYEANKK